MTALQTRNETVLTEYTAPEGGWASDGNEEGPTYYPMIKMVHATSRMTDDAPKHAGEFYHDDLELFTPTLEIVGLVRKDTRAMFIEGNEQPVCRSRDGKVPEPNQDLWQMERILLRRGGEAQALPHGEPTICGKCVFAEWIDHAPPPCKSSIVLLVDRPDYGPAQLQLSGKSIKPYNDLIGRIKAKKHRLFFYRLTLTTVRKSEGGNTWYELAPIKATLMQPEEVQRYNDLVKAMSPQFEAVPDEDIPSAFMAELSELMSLNGLHANAVIKYMKANLTEENVRAFIAQNAYDSVEEFVMDVRKHEGPDSMPFE